MHKFKFSRVLQSRVIQGLYKLIHFEALLEKLNQEVPINPDFRYYVFFFFLTNLGTIAFNPLWPGLLLKEGFCALGAKSERERESKRVFNKELIISVKTR